MNVCYQLGLQIYSAFSVGAPSSPGFLEALAGTHFFFRGKSWGEHLPDVQFMHLTSWENDYGNSRVPEDEEGVGHCHS